jgi:predicted DCC family thiol-disulfide oxidoreductase YuxK
MSAIVLFDGVCNFCDASVNFIIDHDPKGYFKFAPLQSEAGQELATKYGLKSEVSKDDTLAPTDDLVPIDSVILVEDDRVYAHSTAALRVAKKLSGAWKMMYGFIIVPKFIRDFFYRQFAKYRYRFFGKKDQCMIPTKEVRARFL